MKSTQETKPKKSDKSGAGRPTVMTPEVIGKLEQAFAIDATIKEACFYAGINPDTYYEFVKKNPEYSERFEALRETPVLKARRAVVNSLDDPDRAFRYLERKRKNEFSSRQELTGSDGTPLEISWLQSSPTVPENGQDNSTTQQSDG